jgi:uncharacterized protein
MKLNSLSLRDKSVFNQFLSLSRHELSVYAFENIYVWKGLFDIYWAIIEKNLCIFFKDKLGCFLYLAPLGESKSAGLIEEVFKVMDSFNKNKDASRIENIEEEDTGSYKAPGYAIWKKSDDYICKRSDLAGLKGNKFKHKRASLNYFTKHYDFEYLEFSPKHKRACLELYDSWSESRRADNPDHIYQCMMEDSRKSLENALEAYPGLDLTGRVVKIDNRIKAFTFGFELNPDTFCILYEITDLSIKGLSQFIFCRLCAELEDYKYINIMDDSGLENLKKVKLSYHPVKIAAAYILNRKNA